MIDGKIKSKLLSSEVDYARGEGTLYSDSSSEDGGDSEEEIVNDNQDEESSEYFDKWGELDADAERWDTKKIQWISYHGIANHPLCRSTIDLQQSGCG